MLVSIVFRLCFGANIAHGLGKEEVVVFRLDSKILEDGV